MTQSIATVLSYLDASIADLRLSDDERRELASMLRDMAVPEDGLRRVRNRAFEMIRTRVNQDDTLAMIKWLDGVARAIDNVREPVGTVYSEAFFSPGAGCLRAIQNRVRAARQCIDICVFTLSDDRITDEILVAHRRAVKIRLITDNDKEFDAGSDIDTLRRAGVAVAVDRTSAHMHHKFAVFDNQWLINGSYNWTRSACEFNEENLVVTNHQALVLAFCAQFSLLWSTLFKTSG